MNYRWDNGFFSQNSRQLLTWRVRLQECKTVLQQASCRCNYKSFQVDAIANTAFCSPLHVLSLSTHFGSIPICLATSDLDKTFWFSFANQLTLRNLAFPSEIPSFQSQPTWPLTTLQDAFSVVHTTEHPFGSSNTSSNGDFVIMQFPRCLSNKVSDHLTVVCSVVYCCVLNISLLLKIGRSSV